MIMPGPRRQCDTRTPHASLTLQALGMRDALAQALARPQAYGEFQNAHRSVWHPGYVLLLVILDVVLVKQHLRLAMLPSHTSSPRTPEVLLRADSAGVEDLASPGPPLMITDPETQCCKVSCLKPLSSSLARHCV